MSIFFNPDGCVQLRVSSEVDATTARFLRIHTHNDIIITVLFSLGEKSIFQNIILWRQIKRRQRY